MDLQSPETLFTAWILVPLAVAAASAGLGHGLALLSGLELRALMLPAGFTAGISLSTALFYADIAGVATALIIIAAALAGPAWSWFRHGWRPRLPERGSRGGLGWGAFAGLSAFAVAMAPLAGGGRSGVLGYVLNDDAAIHVTLVQHISEGVTGPIDVSRDSFHYTTEALGSGYPLGSYSWPVFARLVGFIDPFHVWVPVCAVTIAMVALVGYALLRELGAPPAYAGIASVFAANGHLMFAYHTQGGLKELIMPVAVYGCAALAAQALRAGTSGRALLPSAIAGAAAVANLGYAGAAWIGPIALAVGAVLVWRWIRGVRIAKPRTLVLFAVGGLLLGLPAALKSITFFRNSEGDLTDPAEVGNLFDAISPWQMLNIWLTGDYRFKPTDSPDFVYTAAAIALVLALAGVVHAARRRDLGLPLALLGGIAGVLLITPRTSIYYDAKTYVALAPALGIATAAGVLLLWVRWRPVRLAAAAGIAVVALGVAASVAMIYLHVWVTPDTRFGEYVEISERLGRIDRILVSDRDQYAMHFLRDIGPWDDWAYRQPWRGLRFPGNTPALPGRAPDLDDFTLDHVKMFAFLLERKSPGGSRAPANYRPIHETEHYRVWERVAEPPREHLPFGIDGQVSSVALECAGRLPQSPELLALAERARKERSPLVASVQDDPPVTAITPEQWGGYDYKRAVPAPETVGARGGGAAAKVQAEPGRYRAWLLGSFGPGVRMYKSEGRRTTDVGDTYNDLASPGWQPMGTVDVREGTVVHLAGMHRSRIFAGGRHFNIIGPLKLIEEDAALRLETLQPDDLGRLCGRNVDWVELPPA